MFSVHPDTQCHIAYNEWSCWVSFPLWLFQLSPLLPLFAHRLKQTHFSLSLFSYGIHGAHSTHDLQQEIITMELIVMCTNFSYYQVSFIIIIWSINSFQWRFCNFQVNLSNRWLRYFCETALRWLSLDLTDGKSALLQVSGTKPLPEPMLTWRCRHMVSLSHNEL